MDKRGYDLLRGVLPDKIHIEPYPPEYKSGDLQYIHVSFEHPIDTSSILNLIGEAGLSGANAKPGGPNLVDRHVVHHSYEHGQNTYIIFEDIAHPNSREATQGP